MPYPGPAIAHVSVQGTLFQDSGRQACHHGFVMSLEAMAPSGLQKLLPVGEELNQNNQICLTFGLGSAFQPAEPERDLRQGVPSEHGGD